MESVDFDWPCGQSTIKTFSLQQHQRARHRRLTESAIHIMGQNNTSSRCKKYRKFRMKTTNSSSYYYCCCWPAESLTLSSLSSSLLLLISVAFTLLTLSSLLLPSSKNLILLTEASSGNIQQQQQGGNLFGGVGNSVIAAPSSSSSSSGKARYKTMYACEDRQLTMDCDFGSKINLIRANYGRFSITQCNEQGQLDLSTDCMSPITFRIMRERCQDKQKCSVNATSAIFGDKCPQTRKYLEVHFQCQPDPQRGQQSQQQPPSGYISNSDQQPDRVDLRNSSQLAQAQQPLPNIYPGPPTTAGAGTILPANNPTGVVHPQHHHQQQQHSQRQPTLFPSNNNNNDEFHNVQPTTQPQQQIPQQQQQNTVMNSDIVDYNAIADARYGGGNSYNNNNISLTDEQQIIVTLRHLHTENMSNPRCVSWDPASKQWTPKGSRIVDTNSTHTTCAFDQAASYMLVMDHHSAPNPSISQPNQPISLPNDITFPLPNLSPPDQGFLETQPTVLHPQDSSGHNKMISPPSSSVNSSSSLVRFFSLFGYMLAIVFVAIAFITIAFIVSTMRTSGTTLKSLGNFTAFGGPKYKNRRADEGLHNKDLLVINNQNGHQFLYAPANTTKITSSTSTHILPGGLAGQHQAGTLHHHIQQQQLQQQQMYSGNGTLSNLSGTGGQSNYYYGLMGSLFQQQQQQQQQQTQLQHHLSQHHLNQQQHPMQQQGLQAANYQHQANKSTISNESANSTPSSSGVESASTSLHQQQQLQQHLQQQQQPQSCLMMNSEYNLMGQVNNYNQQHQTLLSNHPYQHHQPQLTLNAHYSSSGPMTNLGQQQQQRLMMNNSNNLMREHIYESVDDDKQQCMARGMLIPTDQSEQLFNSNTLSQMSQGNNNQQANFNRAMTLSSRLLQTAIQQQQQQLQQQQPLINSSQNNNKRLLPHPAIVRDNQTKTNIICSKLAQVTPQRATEINNKFQHDIMAIFNGNDSSTTTTTTAASTSSPSSGNSSFGGRSDLVNDLRVDGSSNSKVSTDC